MLTPLSLDLSRLVAVALLVVCGTAALAADAANLTANRERQRVLDDRRRVEADYAAQVARCEARFVVTACIEQAKAGRRQALDRLTQQQAVIDDALRKQRKSERLERLQEKQHVAAQRRDAPIVPPRVLRRGLPGSSAGAVPQASSVAPAPSAAQAEHTKAPMTAEQRRRNEAAYQQRQEEALAHRQAVEQRNARRAATRTPAASLPVPAGIPASGASR